MRFSGDSVLPYESNVLFRYKYKEISAQSPMFMAKSDCECRIFFPKKLCFLGRLLEFGGDVVAVGVEVGRVEYLADVVQTLGLA